MTGSDADGDYDELVEPADNEKVSGDFVWDEKESAPNDVLVSSTLRDLVIGSGLEFEERGAHELKGVPGEWRLFAVASS
jgi:hypothetical protein